jgi:hypothetical protein
MTTNIKINTTNNVFEENDVFNLQKIKGIDKLSGMSWLGKIESSKEETRLKIAEYIYKTILEKLPDFNIWIFSVFEGRDNRITQYKYQKDLWKEAYQIKISPDKKKDFVRFVKSENTKRENTIRCYHIIDISGCKEIRDALTRNIFGSNLTYSQYIVALPNTTDMEMALKVDWFDYELFNSNLLRFIVDYGGIVFREVGWFDDLDTGFVGIGDSAILSRLC